MKKSIFCAFCAVVFLFTSCKDKKEVAAENGVEMSEGSKSESFSVDGKTYKGNVSTQIFGSNKETDNFSILCQQDEPFTLLQCTFANRKNAETANLKPKGESYKVEDGEFSLSLSVSDSNNQFIANEKSGGSVKVEGNTLTITNVKLFDRDGNSKIVSETVQF